MARRRRLPGLHGSGTRNARTRDLEPPIRSEKYNKNKKKKEDGR